MPFPVTTTILLGRRGLSALAARNYQQQCELVNKLQREGVIEHEQVIQVMKQVNRANYVAGGGAYSFPYDDSPQSIQCGQTISAPHMHGYALEYILSALEKNKEGGGGGNDGGGGTQKQQQEGQEETMTKVLDVGCGSGYLTAALGRWVHPHDGDARILSKSGKVYGMDIHPQLVDMSRENIEKEDGDLLESGTVTLKVGNGWEGWPDAAPFDAIHVGAAADDFPIKLANQLRVGGIMIVPIGPTYGMQYLYKIERIAHTGNPQSDFQTYRLLGVRYVPLIHERTTSSSSE
jgi:protein-L-isoaspartate(D-aspartate) O-methyltransferase